MKVLRKKRVFAILFILFLVLLFYNSDWLGKLLYPIRYEKDITISAQNYEVDPFLIAAIIRVETNYNPEKISKKGAIGLMQLMPDTAEWIVKKAGYAEETSKLLHRADVNIEVGAWYLNSLYNQFGSNKIATLAAYNAGPGNARKWLDNGTWDGTLKNVDQIPFGETRHYIQRVLYYYDKYVDLYKYQFPA
ncbi:MULTISPECIES: lytic transglycosylase domain-containing protein [Paenibacillus]|jgi:soluble lytic murein transglycosylase|uniref:Lytic transglycosylase domain-containing protein n=1 Tax=Paenibacillus oceani TaxID=2772510 RepID=A0A927C9E3_9BACL|nr:lytic transglycosylase domain-containing protein [Paenibacillus oceani]MBD2863833.1 lytic transglycosylase domain-containing protein [Paenibacillus oceani]